MSGTYEDFMAMEGFFDRFLGKPDNRQDWEKDKDYKKFYSKTYDYGITQAYTLITREVENKRKRFGTNGEGNPYAYINIPPLGLSMKPRARYTIFECAPEMVINCDTDDVKDFLKWMNSMQASMQARVDSLTKGIAKIIVRYGDNIVDTFSSAGMYLEVDQAELYRNYQDEQMQKGGSKENAGEAPAHAQMANEAFFFSTEKSQAKVTNRFNDMESYISGAIECFQTCILAINTALKAITAGKDLEEVMKPIVEGMETSVNTAGAKWAPDDKYIRKMEGLMKTNAGKRLSMAADFKQDSIKEVEKALVIKCQNGGEYYTKMANVVRDMEVLGDKLEAAAIRYKTTSYKVSAIASAVQCWNWVNRNIEAIGYHIQHGIIRVDQKNGFRVDPANESEIPHGQAAMELFGFGKKKHAEPVDPAAMVEDLDAAYKAIVNIYQYIKAEAPKTIQHCKTYLGTVDEDKMDQLCLSVGPYRQGLYQEAGRLLDASSSAMRKVNGHSGETYTDGGAAVSKANTDYAMDLMTKTREIVSLTNSKIVPVENKIKGSTPTGKYDSECRAYCSDALGIIAILISNFAGAADAFKVSAQLG